MITKLAMATCALVLAACAAAPNMAPAPVSGQGTLYCWKERLSTEGDDLVCNWERSIAEACRSSGVVTLKKGAVAKGPTSAGLCANGQWLVAVTAG